MYQNSQTVAELKQLPLMLNSVDIANLFNVSRTNAYCLMHTEGFPSINIGRRLVVYREALITWIESH